MSYSENLVNLKRRRKAELEKMAPFSNYKERVEINKSLFIQSRLFSLYVSSEFFRN